MAMRYKRRASQYGIGSQYGLEQVFIGVLEKIEKINSGDQVSRSSIDDLSRFVLFVLFYCFVYVFITCQEFLHAHAQ